MSGKLNAFLLVIFLESKHIRKLHGLRLFFNSNDEALKAFLCVEILKRAGSFATQKGVPYLTHV